MRNPLASHPSNAFPQRLKASLLGQALRILLALMLCMLMVPAAFSASPYIETAPLPERRMMHGAAVLGQHLYVIGGNREPEGYTAAVHRAAILPDSQLGPWSETTPIPSRRSYIANSTLALNDVIYVVGGLDGVSNKKFNTVLWTRPLPDGNLEPWRESAPFGPYGLSNLTVVSTPGFIHLLGGNTENAQTIDTVVSGVVAPTGGITSWELGIPLPQPTWFHNAAAVGGRVWIWGGLRNENRDSRIGEIFSAPILNSGRLGPWRLEPTRLPEPFYSGAGASAGNYLLTFFPRINPDVPLADVYFAQVSDQGTLSPWQKMSTDIPNKLYLAAAPDYRRGTIYIPAGRIAFEEVSSAISNQVFFFRIAPEVNATSGMAASTPSASGGGVAAANAPASATKGATTSQGGAESTPALLTFQAQSQNTKQAVEGFLSYDKAKAAVAAGPRKPMLLYFHHPNSKPCQQQMALLQAAEFAPISQRAVFGWIDIREWPQVVQQLGVYRAPTWILYNASGGQVGQHSGILSIAQIEAAVNSAQ